jgi:nitrate/nitrite transport system substrate-binding protein
VKDEHPMHFSIRNCNYPQPKFGSWWLSQFRRWGMVSGKPDYQGIVSKVMRPDLYESAMSEIGYKHGGLDNSPFALFDGKSFDLSDPESYATSFPVHSLKG